MLYAFNDAKAAERHETQYFEMFCNRGIYHKGWTAVTRHGVPWVGAYKRAFDDDVWELYDTNTDWTQSKDLAKENPKKLAELQRLFIIEATKYSALPLDDRTFERFNPDLAGRPQLIKGKTQILFGGMGRLSENSIVSIKNKSYAITADLDVPKSGAEGVIVAQGGNIERLEPLRQGRQAEVLLQLLRHRRDVRRSDAADPGRESPGPHGVQVRRRRPRQGRRRHALRRRQVGRSGSHRATRCRWPISADETCDVGKEAGSPVSPDYGPTGNEFSGEVNWVQIDLEKDDHDHMVSPEERFRVAMARQ